MDEFTRNQRYVKIGLNISYYRKLKGLSQETLAEKAGLSRQWLGEIEAPGLVTVISMDALFCIADALELDPYKLLVFRED